MILGRKDGLLKYERIPLRLGEEDAGSGLRGPSRLLV